MDPELRDLLRTVANEPVGDSYTHVSLYGPRSKWNIQPEKISNFWNTYCDLVFKKLQDIDESDPNKSSTDLCLAEKYIDTMPLIAKLNVKFHVESLDDSWEPYYDDFLYHLCHTYQQVINENFKIVTETSMEFVVVVLESSSHWVEDSNDGEKYMNMEIKLQFPYAHINPGDQQRIVRNRVIQLLRTNNILSKLQRQPIGDWEQIISSNISNEPVLLYGGSEVKGRPPLKVTHIWSEITKEMLEDGENPPEIALEDAFETDNHNDVLHQAVPRENFEENNVEYWLPMFLSIGYWPTVLLPKKEFNGRFNNTYTSKQDNQKTFGMRNGNSSYIDNTDKDIELAEKMIQMLNPERFFKETFWKDVGKALYIADDGGDNGILSWIRHSKKSIEGLRTTPDFMLVDGSIDDTCKNLYYTFSESSITIKTLAWYAREDTRERYADWHRDWCMTSMEKALNGNHTDVCEAIYKVYWLDYIYSPIGRGQWYKFAKHKWSIMNQALDLRKCISSDFVKRYENSRTLLSKQIHDSEDEGYKSNCEIILKKIAALIVKLKTVGFKSSLVTECCEFFKDDKFTNYLDINPDLTGLTNGVLEINGNVVEFRAAKPEDYVSKTTNIGYNISYHDKHPLILECYRWFGQVFPDKELLHHFLKFSASCLRGKNSDKIFPIWTGSGDNSKSMMVKLFERAFGEYCIKFPVQMLSEKAANSGGPTPQLARAKGARIAFLDEPEDDVTLHKGIIKRFTGGDSFFARLLQENGGDVESTFKMILTCNKVPVIANPDPAIKKRVSLFPYTSTWIENAPKDINEQYKQRKFQKDPLFDKKIPKLAPAFLWICTQYYPYYDNEKLPNPQLIIEWTESYWRDNDVYAQFAADCIKEHYVDKTAERDSSFRASLSEIYQEFKLWFRDAFPGTRVPERQSVRTELSSRWGRPHGNSWYGITLTSNIETQDMTTSLGGRKQNKNNQPNLIKEPTLIKNESAQISLIKDENNKEPIITKDVNGQISLIKNEIDQVKQITDQKAPKIMVPMTKSPKILIPIKQNSPKFNTQLPS